MALGGAERKRIERDLEHTVQRIIRDLGPLLRLFITDKYTELSFGNAQHSVVVEFTDGERVDVFVDDFEGITMAEIQDKARALARKSEHFLLRSKEPIKVTVKWSNDVWLLIDVDPSTPVFSIEAAARQKALQHALAVIEKQSIVGIEIPTIFGVKHVYVGAKVPAAEYTKEQQEVYDITKLAIERHFRSFLRMSKVNLIGMSMGDAVMGIMDPYLEELTGHVISAFSYKGGPIEKCKGLDITLVKVILDIWNEMMRDEWDIPLGDHSGINPDVTYRFVVQRDEKTCPICATLGNPRSPNLIKGSDAIRDYPFLNSGGDAIRANVHPHCFTPDTDVFTSNGWKGALDIRAGDKVWGITEDLNLIVDDVIAVATSDFKGDLLGFKMKTLDFLATPEHKLPVIRGGEFCQVSIDNIKGSDYLLRGASWDGKDKTIDIGEKEASQEERMEFLGWYIAEGSLVWHKNHWQMSIAQNKGEKYDRIAFLAKKLFYKVWLGSDKVYVIITDEEVARPFHDLGKSYQKHIPRAALDSNISGLQSLFNGLVGGSTRTRTGHSEWNFRPEIIFFTSSGRLASDVTELSLKLGLRPSFAVSQPKTTKFRNGTYTSNYPIHYIRFGRFKRSVLCNKYRARELYEGPVVSITTREHHTLYVRRNGKVLFSGNCRCLLVPN